MNTDAPGSSTGAAETATYWGSDAVCDVLRALEIPWIALTPGASFRGLHDSIVNYLGNRTPRLILCLHEESAVAIAHGWAKVTGTPMAAVVHSNVGLMHATMAVFNAWCDRVPLLLLGATGPVDATQRRPWIDWIHTMRDQGALVRGYTKWDDQPGSVRAAQESVLRAALLATTPPCGPTYVVLDVALQEQRLDSRLPLPDVARYRPPIATAPDGALVDQAVGLLRDAKNPVILIGRVSRDARAWRARRALAETLSARVVTDLKVGSAFPTRHRLHAASTATLPSPECVSLLRSADVILSLDWVDLGGTLRSAWKEDVVGAKVIQVSMDQLVHNGFSMDHQGLPPVDLYFLNDSDKVAAALLARLGVDGDHPVEAPPEAVQPSADMPSTLDISLVVRALHRAAAGGETCLVRMPLSCTTDDWPMEDALDYLGYDGGAGVGSGPGMCVGAALALAGTNRLAMGVLGDGDFLMGATAIWSATNLGLSLLIVIDNNRSYLSDVLHQERVALQRGRPPENKWIGQSISAPDIDLASIARAQGAFAMSITDPLTLASTLADAVRMARAGKVVVVDVRVDRETESSSTRTRLGISQSG